MISIQWQLTRSLLIGFGVLLASGGAALYLGTRAMLISDFDSGAIDLSVMAYRWDARHVYHFVMLTSGGTGIGPFRPMVDSFRKISPQEAAAIRPRIIHVVTVGPGDTVQSLASRMAYRNLKIERFITLNGITADARLVPGQKVKLVVYGARRG